MADDLKLPNFNRSVAIAKKDGGPTDAVVQWWQILVDKFNSLSDLVTAIQTAQSSATAAQTAAATAQAAAVAAQTTANAAVAAVAAVPLATRTVTSNTTMTSSDATILVDATAGAVTVALLSGGIPSVALTVKKIDSSANAVIIQAPGGTHINGAASISLTTQYQTVNCVGNATDGNWYA